MENEITPEMRALIDDVKAAANGAEIRNPLVNVFKTIFNKGKNAELLNNKNADEFALQANGKWLFEGYDSHGIHHNAGDPRTGMATLLPFESWEKKPKKDSTKLVTGGTIFTLTGDLNELPEEVEDILDHGR